MSPASPAIILDEYKDLFKDEASYARFVGLLRASINENAMPIVLAEREFLFTAVPPGATKEILSERIIRRLWENPGLLDDIRDRLENDPIVE
jgi:hypothetical protein